MLHLLLLLLFVATFKKVVLPPPPPLAQEEKIALNLSQFTPLPPEPIAALTPRIPSLAKPVEKKLIRRRLQNLSLRKNF
ncbi:MAG: TonB protein [Campylobacterota bacterium]|nr:TonB protein [Campylobacterota bacterium]